MVSCVLVDGKLTKFGSDWLKETTKTDKALLTDSCTAALEMTAILANIKEGDEIIMPSFTFLSTSNAFVLRLLDSTNNSNNYAKFDFDNPQNNTTYGDGNTTKSQSYQNLGGGWYRCSLTVTFVSAITLVQPHFHMTINDATTYVGEGKTIYLYGAQLETGPNLGRYIKTSGTAITAPTTVKNLSSSSFAGTINGATFNPAGYFDFDGTNDDITTAYTSALDEPQSFTYEVWVNAANVTQSNGFPRIFDKGGTGVLSHLTTSSPFTLAFNINTGSGLRQVSSPSSINGDQWYHIVMKYDGQIGSIYLNGTGAASTDFGSVVQANTPAAGITLGDTPTSGRELQGSIGEFRYYSRELTAAEISQNYNATRGKYGV